MAEKNGVPVKVESRDLRRSDPMGLFDELRSDLTRAWNDMWPFYRTAEPVSTTRFAWIPRLDIFEKDGKLVTKAELPGLQKDDIKVTVEDGDLVIKGERKNESEVKASDYYRIERSYGSFYRRITLPAGVEPDQIAAEYRDGVLEVQIPKPAEDKQAVKTINIS